MHFNFLETTLGVTILVRGRPIHISKEHKLYPKILDALLNGDGEYVTHAMEIVKHELQEQCRLSKDVEYKDGVIKYKGEILRGYVADKLIEMIRAGQPGVKNITNFLEKLYKNESASTIENLYQFLEFGNMVVLENGSFLAYKAVRRDYKDIHSGKFDNSIGKVLEMERRKVDDNRERTCSYGLHVCSFSYLPHFAHADGHIMICEISPEDVVSIPSDYNNTKMRVCKYKVVGEVEGYYENQRDVLGEMGIWEDTYEVWVRTERQGWFLWESFEDLEDAQEEARSIHGDWIDYSEVLEAKVKHDDITLVVYS